MVLNRLERLPYSLAESKDAKKNTALVMLPFPITPSLMILQVLMLAK